MATENTQVSITIESIIKQIENNEKKAVILNNFGTFLVNNNNQEDIDHLLKNLKEDYYDDFISVSRDKKNWVFMFNLEENYCNLLIEKWELEKALFIANSARKNNTTTGFNNYAINLSNRIKDHILIKIGLSKIDEKLQNERFKIIEILWFFVAILAFIFSSIQILTKIQNYDEAKSFLIIIISWLLLFLSLLILVFSNWKNEKLKSYLSLWFTILIIFLFYFVFSPF